MESLLAHCAAAFSGEGLLFLTFFLGGLTGGFTHCLAMCGPYAVCERMCSSKNCGKAKSISLGYHLGRITVYGTLGFFVALLSKQIAAYSWWPWLSSIMLAGAGLLFLISFFNSCVHKSHAKSKSGLTFTRGIMLGFMPCGLLYAALMMAATLTNPLKGMLAMWFFTLGTIPALLFASIGADFLTRHWQNVMQNIGRAVMAFNGVSLIVMAARIMR